MPISEALLYAERCRGEGTPAVPGAPTHPVGLCGYEYLIIGRTHRNRSSVFANFRPSYSPLSKDTTMSLVLSAPERTGEMTPVAGRAGNVLLRRLTPNEGREGVTRSMSPA